MSFSQFLLDARLLKNVGAMGFLEPTPIQEATIPVALQGHDVLGSAETGTGKTAAFVLPLLQRLITSPASRRGVRALVLVPTRELALQVTEHAILLSKGTGLHTAAIYGGVGLGNQEKDLRRGAEIIIATPGRLLDHIGRRNLSFDGLEVLILDEADRMLDVGFLPDLRRIVHLLPRARQTMLFSATLIPSIVRLAEEMTVEPVRIQVEAAPAPEAISQALYPVPEHMKMLVLQKLLEEEGMESVLVFTRTKHRADRVVRQLQRANVRAAVIHGDRSQGQRIAALEAFRDGKSRVLVATDIAARGIDVEGISHVVNYDVPMQPEDYVHRIGRTGRAQAVGQAYTLATPADDLMVRRIEVLLQQKLERRRLEGIDYRASAFNQPDAEAVRRYVEANRRGEARPTSARTDSGRRARMSQSSVR